ncbi:MAG: hypothetical protein DME51_02635 [Verrucomicrobia bacterium]|nr:MAG: hypothetical protein DME51_02635 [Verrucomicrobiota bacterium]
MWNRRINSWRASMAMSGRIRLSNFSRRSGSMAASSRTSLSRVFHFAYLLKPMPIARSAEMIQIVMSVAVNETHSSFFATEFNHKLRKPRNLTFLARIGDFLVRVHRGTVAILCTCVVLANAPLARAQEATSANLPDQFETRESMPTPKSKKKKAEPSLKIAARASTRKPAPATGQTTHPQEEPVTPAMPVQKKTRAKKRTAPAVQSEAASSSTPTPLSLPAAQAMAVSAPLPEYPYQAKRANITGSGVCVITIETASGKVTDAMMAQSTGDAMLDKVTTNTFRRWRFKPGTMSQVRVPVDYE